MTRSEIIEALRHEEDFRLKLEELDGRGGNRVICVEVVTYRGWWMPKWVGRLVHG